MSSLESHSRAVDPLLDVWFDDRVLDHDTGRGFFEAAAGLPGALDEPHPEGPDRLRNMRSLLCHGPLGDRLRWHQGRLASVEELCAVHEPAYVSEVEQLCASGGGRITPTTVLSPASWTALRAAAGSSLAAADAVLAGDCTRSLALVRPPGHHAQPGQADGYGVFNHAALVAQRARDVGLERVAVLDWDVHHGNGTQACFEDRADVLTVSLHMRHGSWGPSHPQTGAPEEIGTGAGRGFNLNLELPLGTGDSGHVAMLREVAVPVIDRFEPQLLVVAAGQDASQFDPNGRQAVTMAGFRAFGGLARELAERHTGGRMVVTQEGGYALTYAAACLHATVEGLCGVGPLLADPLGYLPERTDGVDAAVAAVWTALAGTPLGGTPPTATPPTGTPLAGTPPTPDSAG